MPFKFDSRSFFVTYPQSGELTPQQVLDHLGTVGVLTWARAALEQHEDGSPHIHAIEQWDRRVQTRNERFLDVGGKHPNIQSPRQLQAAIRYVSKDGQFTDIGAVPAAGDPDADWLELAGQLDEAEYFRRAMQARIGYMYADRFWKLSRARKATEVGESHEAVLSRECFELLVHIPAEDRATVVVGPSGCGKTSWAKRVAKKPALWVRHMDMLRAFRAGYHQSIIFDDMAFHHVPREAQIHLVDFTDEAHLHCRYGVAVIPAGVQKIFTANHYPFTSDEAIKRRVFLLEVTGDN